MAGLTSLRSVMSRRSSRLISGGYYNSDDDSDSSSVTNISYRENTVKVFKKKGGSRKGTPPTATPTISSRKARPSLIDAASPTEQHEGNSGLSPSIGHSLSTMRTLAYVSAPPTPRPAINHAPTRCSSRSRSEVTLRSGVKGRAQTGVDSSGYSSSEGSDRKSDGSVGSRSSIGSISSAVHSVVTTASISRVMKRPRALLLLFLLLLLLFSLWWLLPFLTPSLWGRAAANHKSQSHSEAEAPPPLPLQPSVISTTAVLDASAVSAAVDARMERLLAQVQLQQQRLLAEIKLQLQQDVQEVKAQLEGEASHSRLLLKQAVTGLDQQISAHQSESQSAAASLTLRIQLLEAENAMLSQELSSIKLVPPPEPAPEPSASPVLERLSPEMEQRMEEWFSTRAQEHEVDQQNHCNHWSPPMADKMADFALESQGGSVISTRCSETYRIRSACVTLFGFPLWYPSESPRTVIQGHAVLLPGRCWAFHGVEGTLLLSLSHPVSVSHVTVDHLRRSNAPTGRIDSAPKDFEVYGLMDESEAGVLLGKFTYDQQGEPTQTFRLSSPSEVHRLVELRVLSNWGQVEYTCLYRFRVHGEMASSASSP